MGYYTTVRVVGADGRSKKAEVSCGGSSKGFTDANTGEISFEMRSQDRYEVYAKSMGSTAKGEVKGGGQGTIRLS